MTDDEIVHYVLGDVYHDETWVVAKERLRQVIKELRAEADAAYSHGKDVGWHEAQTQ